MVDFWYASFVFLGLSLSIGLMVLLIRRDKSRKRKKRDFEQKLHDHKTEEDKSLLEELEDKYGKKG